MHIKFFDLIFPGSKQLYFKIFPWGIKTQVAEEGTNDANAHYAIVLAPQT